MTLVSELLSSQDVKKFANLQVLAKQVVEGFCAGLHRSPHKGFSVEFKEHRQYVPGDDIRSIDWKLFSFVNTKKRPIFAVRSFSIPVVRWRIPDHGQAG